MTGGGSFLYHLEDNLVVGRLRRPSQLQNPISRPSRNSSASRRIRRSARTFEGGRRLSYGARAITEGGWQSVPKLSFPGGVLIGCSAGFVNCAAHQGQPQRGALRHARRRASRRARSPPAAPMTNSSRSRAAWRAAGIGKDLKQGPQRQAALVEVRHASAASCSAASTCG